MLPAKARHYLLEGLSGTPVVIDRLLADATEKDFDVRPDPARFTIREVLGHLADWEGVWMERATRILNEDHPSLLGYDEGQWAIDHDYAHMNVAEQRARFREGRANFIDLLHDLSPDQWSRTAGHDEWGEVTLAGMATLILGHDGYH